MYIFKNAMKSLTRSKGRNILIIIISLVITISACVALSIRQSAEVAKEATLDSLEITAQISVDRSALIQEGMGRPGEDSGSMDAVRELLENASSLELDELLTYAESEYVDGFYYSLSVNVNGNDDLEPVNSFESPSSSADSGSGSMAGMPGGGMAGGGMMSQSDFSLVGYSSHSAMTGFIDGTKSITEGTMFDEDSTEAEAVISEDLATLNSISVGDEITVVNPNNEEEEITLTVVGVYSTESTMSADEIYTNYDVLQTIVDNSEADEDNASNDTALTGTITGTYVFADVASFEAFKDDAAAMGLDTETYTISSSDVSAFEQSIAPLENLSEYATYFLLVVLIIGAIILVVFNIFAIRERKYEIGVLSAIGMSKVKVATQFITETFVVTFIAIVIGAGIGAAVSSPIANTLLDNQVSAMEETSNTQNENFGGNFGGRMGGPGSDMFSTEISYIDDISVGLDVTVLSQLLGIGILLTMFSSSAAVISILRYDPLKILSDRT